jgi:malate dehydrogenase (oxaloacetate-decarboxylating)
MSHPSPGYSITVRLRYPDRPGYLGRITSLIGDANGLIGAVDMIDVGNNGITRSITISATNVSHGEAIVAGLRAVPEVEILAVADRVFSMHQGGKLEVRSRVPLKTRDDLSMAYTPGVARICQTIADDPEASFSLTIRRNAVAVVTDGSAVLGLGNLGARAAMPVMEGKAILFKEFGGVDAFPICLDTQDVDTIVEVVRCLAPTFGGINLEDISAPRCVAIEEQLVEQLDIPVFHDDQHGTAIVVLAALTNAAKVVDKRLEDLFVVVNGAGAAGVAVVKLLASVGVARMVVCDSRGAIHAGRKDLNPLKEWVAANTNGNRLVGSLAAVIPHADAFIGVSAPNVLTAVDVERMADRAIVFALANPDPEISPEDAAPHAAIVATGRSDYPNQINNVLCFPGLFRGLLDVRARRISTEMKIAAAAAIAGAIDPTNLRADHIVPSVFDRRVAPAVAEAVSRVAIQSGFARGERLPQVVSPTR